MIYFKYGVFEESLIMKQEFQKFVSYITILYGNALLIETITYH